MKKNIEFLFVLVALLLVSCANNIEDNNVILEKSNDNDIVSAGNIQNGGYVIKENDDFFYANQNDCHHLYKLTMDGNEKITDEHFFYEMNLYDNKIFYTSGSPGKVWSISLKTLSKEKIINQRVGNLILYENHLYYRLSEDDDWGKLYRSDLDGKNKKLLATRVENFCIYNNLIYFSNIDEKNALCTVSTNGGNISTINNSYANNIIVENDMLIYSDHNRDDKLFVYNLKNSTESCISEDKCWNINCNENWIFYRNQSEKGDLYCISFDGKNKHKIVEGNVADILVIDNFVFYRNIDESDKIEYFDLMLLEMSE